MISIVNPSSSFSVAATINNVPVTFLLETGSALTILRKSIWDRCKQPDDKLEPWNQQSLVGAEGTTLRVYGSTCVQWEVDGKEFSYNVTVVDPLTTEAILGLDFLKGCKIDLVSHQLTTSDGQVIVLNSQKNNKKTPVLFVRVTANVKIPAYSEMEILADVGDLAQRNQTYVLEDINIQNSDVMVARAVIIPGESIPVRVMNPTDQPVTLYRGTRIAQLAEIEEVEDSPVMVSSVQCGTVSPELEEALWLLAEKASLASEEREKLFLLLLEYADVLALCNDELGRTNVLQHEIHTGDASPIRQQFRRVCPQKRQEMRNLLSEMLEKDVIKPSCSPWASPVVLVKKKDGTSHFCVDYRKVNTITRKDAYPLPRVDDLLDTLAGSRLFSTLDLISGYWQVEIHPRYKEKTAFCTSEGLYEFNVMPFGLCNGPATFQRLMNLLLAGIQWTNCLVYLDDIIVLGKTFQNHLQHLSQVFQKLRDANLKLKVQKCFFVRNQCSFWDTLYRLKDWLQIQLRSREWLIGQFLLLNVRCSNF